MDRDDIYIRLSVSTKRATEALQRFQFALLDAAGDAACEVPRPWEVELEDFLRRLGVPPEETP